MCKPSGQHVTAHFPRCNPMYKAALPARACKPLFQVSPSLHSPKCMAGHFPMHVHGQPVSHVRATLPYTGASPTGPQLCKCLSCIKQVPFPCASASSMRELFSPVQATLPCAGHSLMCRPHDPCASHMTHVQPYGPCGSLAATSHSSLHEAIPEREGDATDEPKRPQG